MPFIIASLEKIGNVAEHQSHIAYARTEYGKSELRALERGVWVAEQSRSGDFEFDTSVPNPRSPPLQTVMVSRIATIGLNRQLSNVESRALDMRRL
jgi:hypothetical protein